MFWSESIPEEFSVEDIGFHQIRCHEDMVEILNIARASFAIPWEETKFWSFEEQAYSHITVAVYDRHVVGYMAYTVNTTLEIENFATDPAMRRRRLGTCMFQHLVSLASKWSLQEIILKVPETNVPAQQFCRAQKMKCIRILHAHYGVTNGDAYEFQHSRDKKRYERGTSNRISEYFQT